jgi:hypothetical protein
LSVIESGRLAPGPIRDAAAKAAGALAALRGELTTLPDAAAASAALKPFEPLRKDGATLDWDTAGQAYMGAAAVERARLGLNPGVKESQAFRPAFDGLRFPRKDKGGAEFNSPHGLTPKMTRESFKGLLDAVPKEWPPR